MNPDTPLTPREETEVRLTALLMGELPPDEAAALHAQMAADPALAALHARLRQAMELLREATALPEQPAPPVPAHLSTERRERLLAHFKTPAPAPARVIVQPRRDWSWAVPLGLAAALIALLGGTVLMSGFSPAVRFGLAEELSDFAAEEGEAASARPGRELWDERPGSIRTTPAVPAGPPPTAAPATTWASQPGKIPTFYNYETSPADYVFKLYSSDGMKPTANAPAPASALASTTVTAGNMSIAASPAPTPVPSAPTPDLFSIPVAEPYTISEPFSTAGKVNVPQKIAVQKSAPAGFGGGLVPPADDLARNKGVAGSVSGTSGTLTFSGAGTLSTNGNAELPALVVTSGGTVAQGVNPTQTFATAKFAPAPVAGLADGGVISQIRPGADFDADGTAKLADAQMPVLGDIPIVGRLFKSEAAPASRPELATLEREARPATEFFFDAGIVAGGAGEGGPRDKSGFSEPLKDNAKGFQDTTANFFGTAVEKSKSPIDSGHARERITLDSLDDFGVRGGKDSSGEMAAAGDILATDARAKSLAFEKDDGIARNLSDRQAGEQELREARRAPADKESKDGEYRRFENQVGLASGANASRESIAALGIELKPVPEVVEFEGFINYGSPIQSNPPGALGESTRNIITPSVINQPIFSTRKATTGLGRDDIDAVELGGVASKDTGKGDGKKAENPVVGRTGFWVDDESVKLNINTASEGVAWDTAARQAAGKEEPSYYNRVAGPEFRAKVEKAKQAKQDSKAALGEPMPVSKPASAAPEAEVLARHLYESVDELTMQAEPKLRTKVTASDEKKMSAGKPVEVAKLEKVLKQVAAKESDERAPAQKPAEPAPIPQPEIATSANAFSTFSLNVSDVAFKLAAASLEQGKMPELATVRSEEFINAFDYRDPEPAAGAALACTTERARYPFAQNRDLLRCSVKTAAVGRQPGRPLNLVLLLDNSGSMERADRVRILHEALRVLAAQLQPQDKLSVVTFARTPRLWADGVAGDKAGEKIARVGEITPQGGTNLDAALDLGYATALKHFQVGSINRVVLLTDGAANLGDVNPDALKQKVEAHRKQGVALDCFGIGWEGYDDTLLEALSRNGDGRYGFINTPEEAATNFAAQLAGALRVAASDVKVQVEWNSRRVTAYRQIGYAKHQLKKEQFRDNTVDAAEIGAAESGNALYVCEVNPRGEGDLATVRVRFKVPGTSDYREHEWTVPYTKDAPPLEQASPALRLAGTASAFSEWLVSSQYATEVTPDRLLGLLNGVPAIYGADPRPQKLEWMIRTAKSVSGR